MRELVRRLLGAAGYEVRRISQHEPKWSDTVEDYYPLQPKPRQGHGLPPHAGLRDVLDRDRDTYESMLGRIASAHSILHGIPQEPTAGRPDLPFWRNHWFSVLDAAALVGFLCALRSAR